VPAGGHTATFPQDGRQLCPFTVFKDNDPNGDSRCDLTQAGRNTQLQSRVAGVVSDFRAVSNDTADGAQNMNIVPVVQFGMGNKPNTTRPPKRSASSPPPESSTPPL
jgi:hypothetical protein